MEAWSSCTRAATRKARSPRLTPPRAPESATGDWAAVETELGTTLPVDYKALIGLYGSGAFIDFLGLYNPFDVRKTVALAPNIHSMGEANRTILALSPDYLPHPPFPAPGGLLPFASTSSAHYLYWVTNGPPDKWPVVVHLVRSGKPAETYPLGLGRFLEEWLDGTLRSPNRVAVMPSILGDLFGDGEAAEAHPYFIPWGSGKYRSFAAVLSPSDAPFAKRVATVRKAIEAVAGPSYLAGECWANEDDRQTGFATAAHWRASYREAEGGGPTLELTLPAEHADAARSVIDAVARATGAGVVNVTDG